MALPNQVLPGFSASLWCQTGASPTALTLTQLSTWTGQVAGIIGTSAGGTGSTAQELLVEDIPAFGQDDASANFAVISVIAIAMEAGGFVSLPIRTLKFIAQ